ncbi:hypothetical protein BHM03_00006317, partial [Ensete ventricosum]
ARILRAVDRWDVAAGMRGGGVVIAGVRGRRLHGLCCTQWSLARTAAATAVAVSWLWQTRVRLLPVRDRPSLLPGPSAT